MIRAYLEAHGFSVVHDSGEESFGSRYIDLKGDSRSLRIIWDGRDQWLIAQDRSTSDRDVVIQRVGPRPIDELDLLGFRQGLADWLHPTGSPGA